MKIENGKEIMANTFPEFRKHQLSESLPNFEQSK